MIRRAISRWSGEGPALVTEVPPAGSVCRNCGAALAGPFCGQCGQRDLPPDPTLREVLADAWDAFISVDGKVIASLRLLLLRPGALTAEYLDGHRVPYMPPLRLYLVCSLLYFLLSSAIPDRPSAPKRTVVDRGGMRLTVDGGPADRRADSARFVRQQKRARDSVQRAIALDSSRRAALASIGRLRSTGPLDNGLVRLADSVRIERKIRRELGPNPGLFQRLVTTRFIRNAERATGNDKVFGETLRQQMPRVMFVLMPAFAGLLALVYRSRRRRYPSHLIASLHLHAFGFVALAVASLVDLLDDSRARAALAIAVGLWMTVHVPLALRRMYGGRVWVAALRACVLAGVYSVFAGFVVTGLALLLIVLY